MLCIEIYKIIELSPFILYQYNQVYMFTELSPFVHFLFNL